MKAAFYRISNGKIIALCDYDDATLSSVIVADTPVGAAYIIVPYGDDISMTEQYVSGGVLTARPELYSEDSETIRANGGANAEGIVTFPLPNGTSVYSFFHDTTTVAGVAETFTFQTLRAGEFQFQFKPPFPYQPLDLEITASVV